ncbi:MAG: hypothetical protein ABIH89_00510 [Elusimicrobiota bacterium]
MKKILAIFIVAVIGLTGTVFAEGVPVNIEAVENLGMGGPGSCVWNRYGVMYNPALLATQSGFHMRLFEMPFSVSNDVFKFYSFYKDNQEDLENFDTLNAARQAVLLREITNSVTSYKIRLKFSALNPSISAGPFPFFGQDGKLWWGVGFYNQFDIGVKMNAGLLIPTVDIWVQGDGVLVVPLAYKLPSVPFNLPGEAYAGINVKYLTRAKYDEYRLSILQFENFSPSSDDIEQGSGFGWDWGLLYGYSDKLKFSLVLKDFLSTRIAYSDSSEVIKGQLNLGSSYKLNNMIQLACDVRDIKFDDIGKATLFAKLYIGGEINLISILRLRGGFYQGYPSFGFGLLGFLNYAFYGRELSDYPGLMPEWNHVISLSIGF